MDFEERLDRLTERHEALTHGVELMAHTQREYQEKNQILMSQVIKSVDSLARIAHLHERRITGLEGG